jgi:hypothetical protein
MNPQRFLLIAWPADHDEDLELTAQDIQDMLDEAQVGGAKVIRPPVIVGVAIEDYVENLP